MRERERKGERKTDSQSHQILRFGSHLNFNFSLNFHLNFTWPSQLVDEVFTAAKACYTKNRIKKKLKKDRKKVT